MTVSTQPLSLNDLVFEMGKLPAGMPMYISGFGPATAPKTIFQHRDALTDLAIEPGPSYGTPTTLASFLRMVGDSGATANHRSAPLWVSLRGTIVFMAVTGVVVTKGFAVVQIENLAPHQGPPLQRISDAEALDRQALASQDRGIDMGSTDVSARHWLLRQLPRERTSNFLRLAAAREDLAGLDAKRAELEAAIATAEAFATEVDYVLGISDGLVPPTPTLNMEI